MKEEKELKPLSHSLKVKPLSQSNTVKPLSKPTALKPSKLSSNLAKERITGKENPKPKKKWFVQVKSKWNHLHGLISKTPYEASTATRIKKPFLQTYGIFEFES